MLSTIWKDETPSDTIKRLLKCCRQHNISIMSTILLLFLLLLAGNAASNSNQEFLFLGQLKLNASAEIQTNGSVTAINSAGQHKGQVFYTLPLQLKNSSFSTSFVFFINQLFPVTLKEGIAFVIASSKTRHDSSGNKQENAIENIFSIAFFTKFSWHNREVDDADNYMAISLNDEMLIEHSPMNYYADGNGELKKVKLTGGKPVQVWVEYDGRVNKLNVTLSPLGIPKPSRPLLSIAQDLSPFVSEDTVYAGISTYNSATLSSHYILGWSFKLNGQAQEFDPSQFAKLTPRQEGFRNWTFISVTCHCVSSGDHLKLPQNYSEEDRRLQGISRRLKGKI